MNSVNSSNKQDCLQRYHELIKSYWTPEIYICVSGRKYDGEKQDLQPFIHNEQHMEGSGGETYWKWWGNGVEKWENLF